MSDNIRVLDIIEDLLEGREIFFRYIKTVNDLMTRPVVQVDLDQTLGEIMEIFDEHKIRHLTVIDIDDKTDKEYFCGVISKRDVLRQLSPGYGTLTEKSTDQASLRMQCSNIVTRHPETVTPEEQLVPAIEKMLHAKVDCLPVVGKNNLVCGILTSTDIVKAFIRIARLSRFAKTKNESNHRLIDLRSTRMRMAVFDPNVLIDSYFQNVEDIMTEELKTLEPNSTLDQAMRMVQEHEVRNIPVLDSNGYFLGIVSDIDILCSLPPNRAINTYRKDEKKVFRSRLFSVNREVSDATRERRTEVRYVMTAVAKLHTVSRDTSLTDAAQMMVDHSVNCLAVVSGDKRHVKIDGILTSTDIMRAVSMLENLVQKNS